MQAGWGESVSLYTMGGIRNVNKASKDHKICKCVLNACLPSFCFLARGRGEPGENLLISVSQLEEIKTERNGNFLLNIFRDPN